MMMMMMYAEVDHGSVSVCLVSMMLLLASYNDHLPHNDIPTRISGLT